MGNKSNMSEVNHIMRRRRTKSGEAAPPKQPPDTSKKSPKKTYNLRSKGKKSVEESVRWVDDDTLYDDYESADDSTYGEDEDEEEEEEKKEGTQVVHGITLPSSMPVSVKIHLHTRIGESEEEYEEEEEYGDDYEDYDEEGEDEDDDDEIPHAFIQSLFASRLGGNRNQPMFIIGEDVKKKGKDKKDKDKDEPALRLSRRESEYFEGLGKQAKKGALKKMKTISEILGESDIPYKFRVLDMDMPPKVQSEVIRKIDAMNRMGPDNGESQKLRNWIDGVLRVPFGKHVPLPVTINDGETKCADF